MAEWFTTIAGTLGILVATLAIVGRLERGKRLRAERQVEVFEHQANLARDTARVLHEVALDRDKQLKDIEKEAAARKAGASEASEELSSAAGNSSKIAGLWNKTFNMDDDEER